MGNPADDGSDGDHAFIDLTADDVGTSMLYGWTSVLAQTKVCIPLFESNFQKWNKNSTLDSKVCDCCWNVVNPVLEGVSMPCTVTA